jgi:hypothetical protein
MLAAVPRTVIVLSAVPSPAMNVRPDVPASVSVPLVTLIVISLTAAPALASLIEMALPFAVENTRFVSSLVACAAGTLLTACAGLLWLKAK